MQYVYIEAHREGVGVAETMHERLQQIPKAQYYHAEHWEDSEED